MPEKGSWSLRDKLHLRRSKPKEAGAESSPSSAQKSFPNETSPTSGDTVRTAVTQSAGATIASSKPPSQCTNSVNPPIQDTIVSLDPTLQPLAEDIEASIQKPLSVTQIRAIDVPPELLWDQAYDDLKKENPELFTSYEAILTHELGDSKTPSDNEMQQTQLERRTQMDKLLISGLDRTARLSKVEKGISDAISVVMSVKSAISSGLSAVPVAAVVWTSVCVALEVFQNPIDQMSSNRDGIVTVTCKMKWYSSLSKLLFKGSAREDEHFAELRGLLAQRILDLYKVLLKYIVKSICTHYRNQAVVFLRGLVKLDDWSGSLDEVTQAETSVREAASDLSDRQNNTFLGLLVDMHISKEENKIMQNCFVADMTSEIEDIQHKTDRLLSESWRWILETPEWQDFITWDESNKQRLLWIRGDAGKGKTMLLIGLVNELTIQLNTHFKFYLSYFFCKGGDSNLNTATAVLRGLIWMLLRQEKSLIRHLAPFRDLGPALFEGRMAFYNLADILRAILRDNALGRVYLVVDGLDECKREQPGLQELLELVNETSDNDKVKWLISSRNETDILEALEENDTKLQLSLELNASRVASAVDAYIDHRMSEIGQRYAQKLRRNKATPGRDQNLGHILQIIKTELQNRSNGTFLWVALVVRELLKCGADKALEKVKRMPRYLNDLYAHFVVEMLSSDDAEECKAVLLIMVNAYRPLLLSELAALANLSELNAHDESVRHCGLLGLDDEDTVYFVHQSAKEYLMQNQSSVVAPDVFPTGYNAGHRVIIFRSLELFASLHRDLFNLQDLGYGINAVKIPEADPLQSLRYCCTYWVDHLCHVVINDKGSDILNDENLEGFWTRQSLYWVEALSLMGNYAIAITAAAKLTELLENALPDSPLLDLIKDFHRFVLLNRIVIERFPLQIYASALIFAPRNSRVRNLFQDQEPKWITTKPVVDSEWDACLQTLHSGQTIIFSVDISPDGTLLALAGNDPALTIWDYGSGSCLHTLTDHIGSVVALAFSPDSKTLLSGSLEGIIRIWSVQKGECLKTLHGHEGMISTIAFSPDGRFASGSNDGTMKIWERKHGNCQTVLDLHIDAVVKMAFSPDGKRLATGSENGIIKVLDAVDGKLLSTMLGHTGRILSLKFTSDDKIASVAADQSVRTWDLINGRTLKILKGPAFVRSAAWSSNGCVAFGLEDGGIEVWNAGTGECLAHLRGHVDWTDSLAFTLNDQLVSGSRDGSVKTWDPSKPSVETLERHRWFTFTICTSPTGYAASAANDGTVKIWNSDGVCLKTLRTGSWRIQSITFSADGTRLASFHFGTMKIWDWRNGECIDILDCDRTPGGETFSANRKRFVALQECRFTDIGENPFKGWSLEYSDLSHARVQSEHQYRLDEQGEWITWKGHNVLWLPLMYRPMHPSFYAIRPDGLAIGSRSRRVLMFSFSSTSLPF